MDNGNIQVHDLTGLIADGVNADDEHVANVDDEVNSVASDDEPMVVQPTSDNVEDAELDQAQIDDDEIMADIVDTQRQGWADACLLTCQPRLLQAIECFSSTRDRLADYIEANRNLRGERTQLRRRVRELEAYVEELVAELKRIKSRSGLRTEIVSFN